MQLFLRRFSWVHGYQSDYILATDEVCVDTKSNRFKVGDGKKKWEELEYTDKLPIPMTLDM